jgi:hypothetical protein
MSKTLITVPLNELRTSDEEGLASLFEQNGKVYRWVKNKGTTGLLAGGSCVTVFTSVPGAACARVICPTGAGASTGLVTIPAGVPRTAIGPSGSDTGDHGWIQVRGTKKISVAQLTTAFAGGERLVATSVLPATGAWGGQFAESADSATTSYHYSKHVQLLQPIATTGAATAVSAVCDIQCL